MYANAIPLGKPWNKGKFIKGKLKMLKQMCIKLTDSELKHLYTLNTPREIENFICTIINNRWN